MTHRARFFASAIVFTLLGLRAAPALADSAPSLVEPTCGMRLPTVLVLPGNAPAILFDDVSTGGLKANVEAALVTSDARADLVSAVDSNGLSVFLLPEVPVGNGFFDLEAMLKCSNGTETRLATRIRLTAPVPFPTSVGSLVHTPSDPPTGRDAVHLELTPEMVAFLPVSQLSLTVDGQKVMSGFNFSPGMELPVNTGDACIENGALHREKRLVKVAIEGFVAGVAEVPAAASTDIEIDCGKIRWSSTIGEKSPSKSWEPTSSSTSAGGCSAAPTSAAGSPLLFTVAFGGLFFAFAGRRRRA